MTRVAWQSHQELETKNKMLNDENLHSKFNSRVFINFLFYINQCKNIVDGYFYFEK
jgi:hypothetical protein